jgi:hypothetical protein
VLIADGLFRKNGLFQIPELVVEYERQREEAGNEKR